MFDRSDLHAAVAANILSAEQATRFEAFLQERRDVGEGTGPENLRFLANFNDIFITTGVILLFVGLGELLQLFANALFEKYSLAAMLAVLLPLAGLAWALMEYFCGRRRLLLPSMALSFLFTLQISLIISNIAYWALGSGQERIGSVSEALEALGTGGMISFGGAFAAALLVFARFRLPFALGLAAMAMAGLIYTGLATYGAFGQLLGSSAIFAVGLVTLVAAIGFDMQDPERVRKASDNAFWLHLAAAPQIIFGLGGIIKDSGLGTDSLGGGLILLTSLVIIAILSLGFNRRALISSSLVTFIITLSALFSEVGISGNYIFMLVAILVGGSVVLLGGGWKTARRGVLTLLPKGGTWARIFPPEPA